MIRIKLFSWRSLMLATSVLLLGACQMPTTRENGPVSITHSQEDLKTATSSHKPSWKIEERKPVYGLFTLSPGGVERNEDLAFIAQNFELIHCILTPAQIEYLHAVNPKFTVLLYINGGSNTKLEQVMEMEKHRDGIAMFRAALLKDSINETTTTFTLQPPTDRKKVSLRASTMPGTYNDTTHNASNRYVTWLRIDDEWMRIEEYDEKTNVVKVSRAFDGSKAAAHSADSLVFAPIYLGSSNTQSAFPGGKKAFLRYTFDVGKPLAANWMAQKTLEAVLYGYDGAWFDVFESAIFNSSDFHGQPVWPWNFNTGKPYTRIEAREGQENRVRTVFDYVFDKTGKHCALYANNMRTDNYYLTGLNPEGTETAGMKNMLLSTSNKPRPLDGFCIENFVGVYLANPNGKTFETQGGIHYSNPNKWREKVKMLADAAQSGIRLMPTAANAGVEVMNLDVNTKWRADFEEFAYASYLLAVEKDGRTLFGTACFYRETDGTRYAGLHEQYYWPIGYPVESKRPELLDEYRLEGYKTYIRHFENGIVLANPEMTADKTITLDREYIEPKTGEKVREVTMDAKSGKILLKNYPQ